MLNNVFVAGLPDLVPVYQQQSLLLLLSGSVALLQKMLNICSDHADQLDIRFNNKKSCLLHIGNSFNKKIENLQLNGQDVCWFEKIKYLGVYILYLEKLSQLMYQPGSESFMPLLMQYYIIQSMLMRYRVLAYVSHLCCQY